MEIFGHLERLIDDLYPYRYAIAVGLLVVAGAAGWLAVRVGLHRVLWRRRRVTVPAGMLLLALLGVMGYGLLAPLWTRTTLYEESPLALTGATIAQPATAAESTPTPTRAKSITVPTSTTAPIQVHTATPSTETRSTPVPATATTPASLPTSVVEPTATTEAVAVLEPTAEPTAEPFAPAVISSGTLAGADDFHFAEGSALLIETEPGVYLLRLEDVSVRNGPDLFVYLSPDPSGIVDGAINLGDLKATDGSFNYGVPPGTDISQFAGVVIWCRAFAVLFATAPF